MTRTEMLAERLEEAFASSKYHCFLSSVHGVKADESVWIPPHYRGFPHMSGSILNLAFHAGGDKHVLLSCAFENSIEGWPEVTARFEAMGGDLKAAKDLAKEGHRKNLEKLATLTDADLETVVPYIGGRSLTIYDLFRIMAEHDLYHAGQINYVRCLWDGLKSDR
ncbi:MAG: DinB family protein [Chthonomonadales bacterium]